MKPLALLTAALTLAFAIAPAVTEPFSGFRPDQLPVPQIDPPVQPAGYAFAIWGVIYLWLVISAGFGVLKRADDPAWDRVRAPLCVSLAAGVPWLAVATTSAPWALVLIWAMAVPAILACLRSPAADRWWLAAPVALYAGWLTAAGMVALGTVAAGFGLGPGAPGWAWLGLAGAAAIGTAVLLRGASFAYAVALAWALVGVAVKNLGGETLLGGVALAAAVGVVALGFRRGRVPA